jgi:DNA polymerase-3 subunit delta'
VSFYLNAVTRLSLDMLLKDTPHALLLTGGAGSGLYTTAEWYAKQLSGVRVTVLPEKDEKIDLEKGSITIQSIRRLYDLTKTIEPNGRTIIIDYAERMGIPAQNAFLKLLEEPTEGTHFILLSHTAQRLLPTIISRTQQVEVRPISRAQSEELLDALGERDATKRSQLLFIAQGLPGELTRLATDEKYFEWRVEVVRDARTYLSGTPYARLQLAKKYKDSRPRALILLEDAMKQMTQTIARGDHDAAISVVTRLETLHKRLSEQGNVRLQLSSGVLL